MTKFYQNGVEIKIGDKVISKDKYSYGWIDEPFGADDTHPMNRPGNVFVSWSDGMRTWTPIENIRYSMRTNMRAKSELLSSRSVHGQRIPD